MKKIKSFAWLLLAATTLMFSSCKKEYDPLTEQFDFNVTFYGAGQRVATGSYSGLSSVGLYHSAVLVYLESDYQWVQLPFTDEDGIVYYYTRVGSKLNFTAALPQGYTWANDFTLNAHAFVIPEYSYYIQ